MMIVDSASTPGRVGHELRQARSRRELFRHTCEAVVDMAPRWGDEGTAIVVTSPPLTRADVQSVFDEISEEYDIAGIQLRFVEQNGGSLQAIFEPIDRRNTQRVQAGLRSSLTIPRVTPARILVREDAEPAHGSSPTPALDPDTVQRTSTVS